MSPLKLEVGGSQPSPTWIRKRRIEVQIRFSKIIHNLRLGRNVFRLYETFLKFFRELNDNQFHYIWFFHENRVSVIWRAAWLSHHKEIGNEKLILKS